MNLALKTYEQLVQLLRNPNLSPGTRAYVLGEIKSRDRTLANQTREILSMIGAL